MKKIALAAVVLILMVNKIIAQPFIEWQRCLGGTGNERGMSATETTDGNIVVVGYTGSDDGDVSAYLGNQDIWLIKLSTSGTLLWEKCFGSVNLTDYVNSVSTTNDNGFIFTGGSSGGGTGHPEIYKTDSAGNVQWIRTYGSIISGAAAAMQTPTGEYISAGNDRVAGNDEYCVAKFDTAGNPVWHKHYGGSDDEYVKALTIAEDGGYVLAGFTQSNDIDVSGNHGSQDYWIVKLDTAGSIQWQKCFGGSGNDICFSIAATPDHGYILAGRTFSSGGQVTGHHGTGPNTDFWIVKIDSAGTLQWQKCLGGSGGEDATSIFVTPDNNYIAAGPMYSIDGDVSGWRGFFDMWITCLDSSGNLLWQKCAGGTGEEYAYNVAPVSDGGFVVTGYAASNNVDVYGNHGNEDIWVVKFNSDFNRITGNAYYDLNSNAVNDASDAPVKHLTIRENNTGKFNFSDVNGNYTLTVFDTGHYTMQPVNTIDYYTIPAPQTAGFNGFYQLDSLNDFAYQSTGSYNDLCITISPLGNFRTNQYAMYAINYFNDGTTTLSPVINFFNDTSITYVPSGSPSSISPDSVKWVLPPLAPFQSGTLLVTIHVKPGIPIGTPINSAVRIDPVAGDVNPSCNYSSWKNYVVASLDPNGVLVNRDTVFSNELVTPGYLEYVINFQNTGNDTAFNITVMNNLPLTLDHSSIEIIATSHTAGINYYSYAGLMEFNFNNILLPQKNVNEPASHGFIRYRIKPLSTLISGDSIKNAAAIYFDYNTAVLTNTAVTEIVFPTGIPSLTGATTGYIIYPVPATEFITLRSVSAFNKEVLINIFDVTGRKVAQMPVAGNTGSEEVTIDISAIEPGVYFVTAGESPAGKFIKSKN